MPRVGVGVALGIKWKISEIKKCRVAWNLETNGLKRNVMGKGEGKQVWLN